MQVKHLMEDAGRKRIAFVNGCTAGELGKAKVRGHLRALAECGSRIEDHLVVERTYVGEDASKTGLVMAHEVLASGFEFDALVTTSDSLALGAMSALVQAGKRVPEDIAIIGFDDEDFAAALPVPLSSIHQPRDLGVEAYRLLQRLIKEQGTESNGKPKNIVMQPELVARASTLGRGAGPSI